MRTNARIGCSGSGPSIGGPGKARGYLVPDIASSTSCFFCSCIACCTVCRAKAFGMRSVIRMGSPLRISMTGFGPLRKWTCVAMGTTSAIGALAITRNTPLSMDIGRLASTNFPSGYRNRQFPDSFSQSAAMSKLRIADRGWPRLIEKAPNRLKKGCFRNCTSSITALSF